MAGYASGFDAALVTAADAQRIATDATAAEHMLATIKAMAAARVAETELWRKEGDASPAHQLARRSGTSVSKVKEALDTDDPRHPANSTTDARATAEST